MEQIETQQLPQKFYLVGGGRHPSTRAARRSSRFPRRAFRVGAMMVRPNRRTPVNVEFIVGNFDEIVKKVRSGSLIVQHRIDQNVDVDELHAIRAVALGQEPEGPMVKRTAEDETDDDPIDNPDDTDDTDDTDLEAMALEAAAQAKSVAAEVTATLAALPTPVQAAPEDPGEESFEPIMEDGPADGPGDEPMDEPGDDHNPAEDAFGEDTPEAYEDAQDPEEGQEADYSAEEPQEGGQDQESEPYDDQGDFDEPASDSEPMDEPSMDEPMGEGGEGEAMEAASAAPADTTVDADVEPEPEKRWLPEGVETMSKKALTALCVERNIAIVGKRNQAQLVDMLKNWLKG